MSDTNTGGRDALEPETLNRDQKPRLRGVTDDREMSGLLCFPWIVFTDDC